VAEKPACPLCGENLEEAPAVHDPIQCATTELHKGRETIKKLKASIKDWVEAWYHYREIVGVMSWQHNNCPYERKSAMLEPQIDVYYNGKLVGAALDTGAEAAIKRLMSYTPSPETIALVNRMQESKSK
jgi:hypothetical protein